MKLIYATTLTLIVSICLTPCAAAKAKDDQQKPTLLEAVGILERAKESNRKFVIQLKKRHLEERVNAEWAEAYQNKLRQSFKTVAPKQKGELAQVDCRQTLCALELSFRSHDDFLLSEPEIWQWLSLTQPCGFHIPGEADPLSKEKLVKRIYIDCDQ